MAFIEFNDSQLLETSMLKRPYISSIAHELGIDTNIINQEELIRYIGTKAPYPSDFSRYFMNELDKNPGANSAGEFNQG